MVQTIEGVVFDINLYYDNLHFMTTAGKLKSVQGGLKWVTMTRDRPVKKFRIKLRSKVKRMNKHTFMGVLTTCPSAGNRFQYHSAAETTDVNHVVVTMHTRYNEWHQDFNFRKI